jgi:hypothetical protein
LASRRRMSKTENTPLQSSLQCPPFCCVCFRIWKNVIVPTRCQSTSIFQIHVRPHALPFDCLPPPDVRLQLKALSGHTSKKVELLRDLNDFFSKQVGATLDGQRRRRGCRPLPPLPPRRPSVAHCSSAFRICRRK